MKVLLYVLWMYSAQPWGFHGIMISPGWASVTVTDTEQECIMMRNTIPLNPQTHAALCLPAGLEPNGVIAHGITQEEYRRY